jgi:hypothetical protein
VPLADPSTGGQLPHDSLRHASASRGPHVLQRGVSRQLGCSE